MKAAAAYLVGEHDFVSFCSAGHQAEETVRTLYEVSVEAREENQICIRLRGSGFLYNMVRIIAGTLMQAGIGMYPPEHVKEILEARDRRLAGQTAPAKGLTLIGIEYEKEQKKEIRGGNEHCPGRLGPIGRPYGEYCDYGEQRRYTRGALPAGGTDGPSGVPKRGEGGLRAVPEGTAGDGRRTVRTLPAPEGSCEGGRRLGKFVAGGVCAELIFCGMEQIVYRSGAVDLYTGFR